jgi:hypothetical protein
MLAHPSEPMLVSLCADYRHGISTEFVVLEIREQVHTIFPTDCVEFIRRICYYKTVTYLLKSG